MMLSTCLLSLLSGLPPRLPGLGVGVVLGDADDGHRLFVNPEQAKPRQLFDHGSVAKRVDRRFQRERPVGLGHDEQVDEEASQLGCLDADPGVKPDFGVELLPHGRILSRSVVDPTSATG